MKKDILIFLYIFMLGAIISFPMCGLDPSLGIITAILFTAGIVATTKNKDKWS